MIIDRNLLKEYPFDGAFYTYGVDKTKPLEEQIEEEILVMETKCDIQEAQKSDAYGVITSSYNVYFPFYKDGIVEIHKGMTFKGSVYGLQISGIVDGLIPSQLGGCACHLKDVEV